MCLFFYISGVLSGYLAWRMSSAPRLWDAEDEVVYWRKRWVEAMAQNDRLQRDPEEI